MQKMRLQVRGRSLYTSYKTGRGRGARYSRPDEPLNPLNRTGRSKSRSKGRSTGSCTEKNAYATEESS